MQPVQPLEPRTIFTKGVRVVLVALSLGALWRLRAWSAEPTPMEQGVVPMGPSQMPPTTPSEPVAPGVVPRMPRGMRGGAK